MASEKRGSTGQKGKGKKLTVRTERLRDLVVPKEDADQVRGGNGGTSLHSLTSRAPRG